MNNRFEFVDASRVYVVKFDRAADVKAAEETLLLAILAVACLHGDSAVEIDARYAMDVAEGSIVIDASTPIGQYVLRVFTGLCARQFGEGEFEIVRPGIMVRPPVTRPKPPRQPRLRNRNRARQTLAAGAD